jgi:hypothetical protein
VAILQQDLTEVRAAAAENLQEELQAEVDRAREEVEESLLTAKRKEEDARAAECNARIAAEAQARLEQQNVKQKEALEKAQLALVDARRKQYDAERTAQTLQASLTASDNERKQWQAQLVSSAREGRSMNHGASTLVSSSTAFGSTHGSNMTSALIIGATSQGSSVPEPTHTQPTQGEPTLATERSRKPQPPARPSTAPAPAAGVIDCSSSIRAHGSAGSCSARRRLVLPTGGASATIRMVPPAAPCLSECVPSWGQAFSVVSDVKCRLPSSARRRLTPSEVSERAIYRFFVPPP